jgi:hypothetical protein
MFENMRNRDGCGVVTVESDWLCVTVDVDGGRLIINIIYTIISMVDRSWGWVCVDASVV